jgi:hypothetical protein
MIKIVLSEKGRYGPRIFCDHCGEKIEDARAGSCEFLVHSAGDRIGEPVTGDLFFAHKQCSRAFEAEHFEFGQKWHVGDISALPIRLAASLGMDIESKLSDNGFELEYILRGTLLSC